MARFRIGNAAGDPWTGVSPNKTAASMADWETHPLTKGLETIVDASTADQIRGQKWCAMTSGRHPYAAKRIAGKFVLLHRMVSGAQKGEIVDHINRNTLDNRIANLRITSRAVNSLNSGVPANSSTGVRGVHFEKATGMYAAHIGVNGKTVRLGRHKTCLSAARARSEYEAKLMEALTDG